MKKEIAIELNEFAKKIEAAYSHKDRAMNFNQETFSIEKITPTSEHTATVTFRKTSGKVGLAFLYYIPNGAAKGWRYFFPTDSHLTGMRAFEISKMMAEAENYQYNFKPSGELSPEQKAN